MHILNISNTNYVTTILKSKYINGEYKHPFNIFSHLISFLKLFPNWM